MSLLHQQTCKPVAKGQATIATSQINEYLPQLPQWNNKNYLAIQRNFTFNNYYQTIAFVNAVAWIAHQNDHHPDLEVGYNHCNVIYTTHAVNGLSLNDFICAAKIDALVDSE
jgi:4a-hydroxytetrahydrobiopterin dehydratase